MTAETSDGLETTIPSVSSESIPSSLLEESSETISSIPILNEDTTDSQPEHNICSLIDVQDINTDEQEEPDDVDDNVPLLIRYTNQHDNNRQNQNCSHNLYLLQEHPEPISQQRITYPPRFDSLDQAANSTDAAHQSRIMERISTDLNQGPVVNARPEDINQHFVITGANHGLVQPTSSTSATGHRIGSPSSLRGYGTLRENQDSQQYRSQPMISFPLFLPGVRSWLNQNLSQGEETMPLLGPNSSYSTTDGFPDDPPPYYTETTSETIDVLPTYQEVTAANEDDEIECLEQCGGFLLSAFFFLLILGAAVLTVLPLFLPDDGPFSYTTVSQSTPSPGPAISLAPSFGIHGQYSSQDLSFTSQTR